MQSAPMPNNEEARIAKLNFYQILDTPPEEAFDRITRIISELIGVPIALVSLVDSERQWFKSKSGLDADETPRDIAFCAHAILQEDLFEVTDPTKDERFYDNPLVVGGPRIRFYAGAPLTAPDGFNLGTLCAIDTKPRRLTKKKKRLLTDFAKIVVDALELRIALKNAVTLAEAEAKQTKLKDEFVSTISHELRTPLTSIQGALGLLRGGVLGNLDERAMKIVDIAANNSERLIRLINDILDIERMESGNLRLKQETLDVAGLLEEAIAANESYADQFKVALHLDDAVPELTINGDRDRLLQVLGNLISNAAKFSPENSIVKIAAARVDGVARIYVIDSGPGISEQFKASIFNKFAQADGSDSRKRGGSGLGLNITKKIVEQHGGTVGFETEAGKGTVFHFELPIVETNLTTMSGDRQTQPVHTGNRVLRAGDIGAT